MVGSWLKWDRRAIRGRQTGDEALLGGSLRTVQRRGERSERFTGLYPFEHRPTLIYNMLRSSVTRHFSSQSGFFTPDANREKAEMSPLSLRYRGCTSHAFLSHFSQHLLESPETFARLHFISPFPYVKENLNWNFFTLSPPCVEMPHKIFYSSTAVYECFSRSIP